MLPSLKKSSDKSSALVVPAWHPNFRNFERLPDTKAVRTSFFINGVAIVIVAVLALYTGYREYGLSTLKDDTADALAQIQANKPASEQALAQFKKFQEQEKKVMALQSFLAPAKIVVSDFILEVGGGLPPTITLNSIDYRATSVSLRGGIEGAPDEASGRAIAYVEALRKNEIFSGLFETITLTNIVRDPSSGLIKFEIDLQFKTTAKAGVAKSTAGGKK